MKKMVVFVAGLIFLLTWVQTGNAQDRSPAELDQMLGPIALYPDPLIAEILAAATFPDQIVEADRFIVGGGDPNDIEQQGWDPSVQAVAHYPNVLKWLDDNIAWTTQLGQAFASQQADVMASVQRLRGQAQSLGNLPSTAQETVSSDEGDIEIEPTDPDELYVPDYNPTVIYYQPGFYCTFGFGLPIGGWLIHDWDWHSHHLITWGPRHPRPGDWWHRSPGDRHTFITHNHAPVWRPASGRVVASHPAWERGYAPEVVSRVAPRPIVPRGAAPRIGEPRAGEPRVGEPRVEPRATPRVGEPRVEPRATPGVGAPRVEPRVEPRIEPRAAPRVPAQNEFRPAARAPEAPRNFAPAAPVERASPFGGSQSAPAARESSARGQESRGSMGGGSRGPSNKH